MLRFHSLTLTRSCIFSTDRFPNFVFHLQMFENCSASEIQTILTQGLSFNTNVSAEFKALSSSSLHREKGMQTDFISCCLNVLTLVSAAALWLWLKHRVLVFYFGLIRMILFYLGGWSSVCLLVRCWTSLRAFIQQILNPAPPPAVFQIKVFEGFPSFYGRWWFLSTNIKTADPSSGERATFIVW